MMMLWYLACFPLTYVVVMVSIQKGADECNGTARRNMQQALAALEQRESDSSHNAVGT